ncbi:MAG: SLC13 family permease [Pirellulaceae bacterium]|nr:SLC13 family permease [Pirellulaceae bacterium]
MPIILANRIEPTSLGVTLFFAVLLVGLITCLALEEKIHAKKSIIAGVFAIVCLLAGSFFEILPFQAVVVGSHHLISHSEVAGEYLVEDGEGGTDDQTAQEIRITPLQDERSSATHSEHPIYVDGHQIHMPVYIPGIDWGVIAIIMGSSLFVDVTSRSGLFTWIAIRVTKASGGDPLKLLASYGVMTVIFSAVLNNVTAMIIVGSLTAVSLEKLNRRQQLLAFLFLEGLLTNIGGLLTLISSVPNIIVGTAANIDFATFFIKSSPFVAVTTAVTIWMGAKLFGIHSLKTVDERESALRTVADFDENDGIQSRGFFYFAAVMLALFIVTIATTSILPYIDDLQMGFVALSFAGIMLLRFKSEVDKFYRALDWDLLGFFMALFVVINVMEHAGVLDLIGLGLAKVIELGDQIGTGAILVCAALFSSVTDNIPLAAMLAKILKGLGTPDSSPLWWAVIFGANLGGNITPIGSASTLVAVTIMHKHGLTVSFAKFVKIALPFAALQIALATIYVLAILS